MYTLLWILLSPVILFLAIIVFLCAIYVGIIILAVMFYICMLILGIFVYIIAAIFYAIGVVWKAIVKFFSIG